MKMDISVTGNTVLIKGEGMDNFAGTGWFDVKNVGMKGSVARWCWDEMSNYAISLHPLPDNFLSDPLLDTFY